MATKSAVDNLQFVAYLLAMKITLEFSHYSTFVLPLTLTEWNVKLS